MHYDVPYKTKQFFFALIKLSIVVGAFYFIYSKLAENENLQFNEFIAFLKNNNTFSLKNITLLVLLSLFNWFFEILKWQFLVNTIEKISFKDALEQSLGGLTASLITPNRIGEYGAKAIYFTKQLRPKIVVLNLLGNMAQMTITCVFGSIAFIIFVNQYAIEINYYRVAKFGSLFLVIGILSLFGIKHKRFNIKGFSISRIINFIKKITLKSHLLIFIFALLRYLIFSFQFYYLLLLFGIELGYKEAMVVISSMYLLASIIPSISIFDVVIKGSVAVYLFSFLDINELTILSTTTLMWLLNFMVPSVIGSYFVINFKLTQPIK